MKHLKTYEGLFDFLKRRKKDDSLVSINQYDLVGKPNKKTPHLDDERYMSNDRLEEISDIIADCLQDIFDDWGISKRDTKYSQELEGGIYWNYKGKIENGDIVQVKNGVFIYNVSDDWYSSLLNDVWDLKEQMEGLCGVVIDVSGVPPWEKLEDGKIEIDFPFYDQKSYRRNEGIFDIFRQQEKEKELDVNTIKDLVESDLDGLSYKGIDLVSNIEYDNRYYKTTIHGDPVEGRDVWFDRKIRYAYSPGGFLNIKALSDDKRMGLVLFRNDDMEFDIRDSFEFIYKIYDSINYQRMKEYGIGYCIYKRVNYDAILFYPL